MATEGQATFICIFTKGEGWWGEEAQAQGLKTMCSLPPRRCPRLGQFSPSDALLSQQ